MSTDFSSIDRLVEFGLGLGLAQQMVNTMNYTMNTMKVAGVNAGTTGPIPAGACSIGVKWYAVVDNKIVGALTQAELERLIKEGKISEDSFIWREGMNEWKLASDIPVINKIILLTQ